jgi:hypothetical protein
MRPFALLGFAVAMLASGPVSIGRQGIPANPTVPTVISGELPQFSPLVVQVGMQAFTVLRVTTDGERVSSIEALDPHAMMTPQAVDAIRTWRFARHRATSFETRIEHLVRDDVAGCYDSDRNARWELRLPTHLRKLSVANWICEPGILVPAQLAARNLRGVVRCECPAGYVTDPLAGAEFQVRRPGDERFSLRFSTDETGRFDAGPQLAPGRYLVGLSKFGFQSAAYEVEISRGAAGRDIEISLARHPEYRDPQPATVESAPMLFYPEEARVRGIEGGVRVRMDSSGRANAVEGPPELVSAVRDHAASWNLVGPPAKPFEIGYSFLLLPGDCSSDQNGVVTMAFPRHVEVQAKRRVSCNGEWYRPGPAVPVVVDAQEPRYVPLADAARLEGDVRLRVTTDGGRSVAIDTLEMRATNERTKGAEELLRYGAVELVRAWRFAPHDPTSFESVVRYRMAPRQGSSEAEYRTPRFFGRLPTDVPPEPLGPWVRAATFPGYPVELRRAGIEGLARIVVRSDGSVVQGSGPAALTSAAAAVVRRWDIQGLRQTHAEFRFDYRLVPGDCDRDQNPVVIVRWNHEIEIAAKRPVACGDIK